MRYFGIALLLVGFIWIAWDAADGFVGYQHTRWVWQSQDLPEGETIKRTEAPFGQKEVQPSSQPELKVTE
jgi:hypothetical protein